MIISVSSPLPPMVAYSLDNFGLIAAKSGGTIWVEQAIAKTRRALF